MRYMDLHKSEPVRETEGEEFFQSVAPGYASPRTLALPGLEGLFFVVLTTAALVAGMLLISLVTSRTLSIPGGGAGSLQTTPAVSTPAALQSTTAPESVQPVGSGLQVTGQPQGTTVSAEVLQSGLPLAEIRY
jgi:hypothetical protein